MAEIYSKTGVVKSGTIEISKGFSDLVVSTDLLYDDITTETITAYVERKGDTIDICRDVLLLDLIVLGTESQDAIVQMGDFSTVAVVDFTVNGGNIELGENEKIKIVLNNLKSTKKYQLNTLDAPFSDNEIQQFVRKTIASENLDITFDVRGYDFMSIEKSDTINEVAITYDNQAVVKFTPWELETMHKSIDPIVSVTNDGVKSGFSNRILIPLIGMTSVNVRKSSGTLINLSLRINQTDALLYGVNR